LASKLQGSILTWYCMFSGNRTWYSIPSSTSYTTSNNAAIRRTSTLQCHWGTENWYIRSAEETRGYFLYAPVMNIFRTYCFTYVCLPCTYIQTSCKSSI